MHNLLLRKNRKKALYSLNKNRDYEIYFFGSYILENYTKESDIDILFVNKDKKLVDKAYREISTIIGKDLNPLIYTRKNLNQIC